MSGKLDCFIYLLWLSVVGAGVEKNMKITEKQLVPSKEEKE